MTRPTETTASALQRRLTAHGLASSYLPWLDSPHLALALAAAVAVATEWAVQFGREQATRSAHVLLALGLLLRASAAAAGLLYAWRRQDRLRLVPILLVGIGFQIAWMGMHLALGTKPDQDLGFYHRQGQTLLDGGYPRSEYPTGAVLLFALESWLGSGANRIPHALLMVPCQMAVVASIWSLRTRWSPWLAAFVAVWPMNAFHWEFRYDLLPTALLAVGLALAVRERWLGAGVAFGIGTATKWTPALCFLALVVWLISKGQRRAAAAAAGGFVVSWCLLTIPLLVWRPHEVWAAYSKQGNRGITGESIWYLPLRAAHQARLGMDLSFDGNAPHWANIGVVALQVMLVLALLAIVWNLSSLSSAAAVSVLVPVVFLLTNRVFSSQFLVTILAAWALAAALVLRDRRAQLAAAIVAAAATCANALVHPYTVPKVWELASAGLFVAAVALTVWLLVAACRSDIAPAR